MSSVFTEDNKIDEIAAHKNIKIKIGNDFLKDNLSLFDDKQIKNI